MPSQHPDQQTLEQQKGDQGFTQKVKALQRRVREMGVIADGSDDRDFMDEGWGESSEK